MVKLSVIIPVYNVEKYIGKCAKSLFEQTLDDMEFIFVDDGTKDKSIDVVKNILNNYPQRLNQVKILHQLNEGPLQARLNGIQEAKGNYITCVDSDDWIDSDTLEVLYNQAVKEDSECVIMGYKREFLDHAESCHRIFPDKTGKELMHHLYLYPFELFTWGIILKNNDNLKEIINNYKNKAELKGITMWEDVALMMPLYYGAKKISYCDKCFYHYNRTNVSSALNTISIEKAHQALNVMHFLCNYFKDDDKMKLTLGSMTLGAKNMLLGKVPLKEWRNRESWCNSYILKYKSIPIKIRLFYWLLAHGFDWISTIYKKLHKVDISLK